MQVEVAYRKQRCRRLSRVTMLVVMTAWTAGARAQDSQSGTAATPSSAATTNAAKAPDTPAGQSTKTASENKAEVSSHDTGTTFKLRVNLVQVRVVVRDKQGKLVDGLKKEDFLLYDQGKLQAISTFGVETPKTRLERAEMAGET